MTAEELNLVKQAQSRLRAETVPVVRLLNQPLLGQLPVDVDYTEESPTARLMVFMKAQGWTNVRIAGELNVSESCVSRTTRQEWFQNNLLRLLADLGGDSVRQLIRIYSTEALHQVYDHMQSSDSEKIRVQCAFKLLDLEHGNKQVHVLKQAEDPKRLDEEIRQLNEQLEAVQGRMQALPQIGGN